MKVLLLGDAFKEQIKAALPIHLKPERFLRIALTALTRTPKLQECTQESFFKCLLDLSAMGLEPDGRRAHLIPYGKECTLIVDYKGIVELVLRSGEIAKVRADVVRENDEFIYDKGEVKIHKIDFRKDRGPIYAIYAEATNKDGVQQAECMSVSDVEAIRSRSKAANAGPWKTDWNEMAKKTTFRRLSKWLPLSAELREKIESDDSVVGAEINVTPSREFAEALKGRPVVSGPDPEDDLSFGEDGKWPEVGQEVQS